MGSLRGQVYADASVTATSSDGAIAQLLASDEPAIRYLTLVQVLGESPTGKAASRERAKIRTSSPMVAKLLAEMRRADGLIPRGTYDKWVGGHWVLAFLSELGYPPGDRRLKPQAGRCADWAVGMSGTLIDGRWRRCASQQSYALLYLTKLGFDDERCDRLADKLIEWQWPDGGWNCDKRPQATHSSFHESLLPMRALFHYADFTGRADAKRAAKKAAKMFLNRKLFRRKSTGAVMDTRFLELHYPYHWRYNILHGLKAMTEAGLRNHRGCREAASVLRKLQLPNGGFASPRRNYNLGYDKPSPRSPAEFGPYGTKKMNPFVTIDALYVLTSAAGGRGSGESS